MRSPLQFNLPNSKPSQLHEQPILAFHKILSWAPHFIGLVRQNAFGGTKINEFFCIGNLVLEMVILVQHVLSRLFRRVLFAVSNEFAA
jgi:hypothetical protein